MQKTIYHDLAVGKGKCDLKCIPLVKTNLKMSERLHGMNASIKITKGIIIFFSKIAY